MSDDDDTNDDLVDDLEGEEDGEGLAAASPEDDSANQTIPTSRQRPLKARPRLRSRLTSCLA